MGTLADHIEAYIKEMLRNSDTRAIELNRAHLAEVFSCVPSQINYVLSTRFSKERGYVIESRRGGGGYIRVVKIDVSSKSLSDILREIGNSLSEKQMGHLLMLFGDARLLSASQIRLIRGIIQQETAGIAQGKDRMRASLFRAMIYMVLHNQEV